jgi:phosphatidate phosphatase APP1
MSIVIWQLSVTELSGKTFISGVVLKMRKSEKRCKNDFVENLISIFKSYFVTTYNHKEITVKTDKKEFKTITGFKGDFFIETPVKNIKSINIYAGDMLLPIINEYPIFFNNTGTEISIISDIDDTIIVSHTAKSLKRIKTLLLVSPKNRKIIKFSFNLLNKIKNKGGDVFYVSKSESNLFRLLSCFITKNGLPQGEIHLTSYQNIYDLLFKNKEKDVKFKKVNFILKNTGNKRFILLGDDTQQDMLIYKRISELFPGRIFRIYIRRTRKKHNSKQKILIEHLKDFHIPVTFFSDETNMENEFLVY